MTNVRAYSIAFGGGAFGDEGKGRIVDEFVEKFSKRGPVVVYRDNGGSNAGHTVEIGEHVHMALHQLPSGIFHPKAIVLLGKGMVIHPGDLIEEIREATSKARDGIATIMIDEMAVLCLDLHRAYEAALRGWFGSVAAATGRGISPAYADVIQRHVLRMRDLRDFDTAKFAKHYELYASLLKGLGMSLAGSKVPSLTDSGPNVVGSLEEFLKKLQKQRRVLAPYIADVSTFTMKAWHNRRYSFVFEKAQAMGLDYRYGVYPDVSVSDMTFDGIRMSTEGIIEPDDIKAKVSVIKATYMSSVGKRILPAAMDDSLATRIREDAHEYGATTKRPRDIYHLDLAAITYFARINKPTHFVLTHMDIVYPKVPVAVCIGYEKRGKRVPYRPDQEYLLDLTPVYKTFKPWDVAAIRAAKTKKQIPKEAGIFLSFIEKSLGVPILAITTGPKRNQSVYL